MGGSWWRAALVGLALVVLVVGCMGAPGRGSRLEPAGHYDAPSIDRNKDPTDATGPLILVLGAALVGGAFVLDLLTLPIAIAYDEPFYLSKGAIGMLTRGG